MNLRQLEILRAVIRHRTTVAAADELALSQPAISNALKAMETQAGFALFERVNNRLFPTTEAMALYKESEAIFALHAKLENRVRDLRECRSGLLSIVSTPPLAYSIIPPALSGFLSRRPQTRVFFDVRRYEGIMGWSAERDWARPCAKALHKPERRSCRRSRCGIVTRPACSRPPASAPRWSIRSRRARAAATILSCGLSRRKHRPSHICCGPKPNLSRVWRRHF